MELPRRNEVHGNLALVGPTASGKSALALELARRLGNAEIVSIDSMQVYRGMDIGTAKPSISDQREIPHHAIDLVDPVEEFSLTQFQAAARAAIAGIEARGKRAILVGGTGLYLQAVVDGFSIPGQFPDVRAQLEANSDTEELHRQLAILDPVAAARMEPSNRRRIMRALEVTVGSGKRFSSFGPGLVQFPETPFRLFGIWLPRQTGVRRISERVEAMLASGWIEEVAGLQRRWPDGLSRTASQALGYREILEHLASLDNLNSDSFNSLNLDAPSVDALKSIDALKTEITRRTRAFARRQRVWFRRDPRIIWFGTVDDPMSLLPAIEQEASRL